jgi:hypothetical protein
VVRNLGQPLDTCAVVGQQNNAVKTLKIAAHKKLTI